MSDLTRETLAELRRLAATAADATTERTPWYSADDLLAYGVESEDDAPYFAALTPPIVLELLDAATELDHMREARDNARAEVERLTAENANLLAVVNSGVLDATRGGVRVPRFDVPYPGGTTTAEFMHTMADRLRQGGPRRLMGSNCSNTAADILDAYADALAALDGEGDQ